jgi:hypothetical protein
MVLSATRRNIPEDTILLTDFLPWWWRSYVPLKRRFLQDPYGVTFQKTAFVVVTAVETWYLIKSNKLSQLPIIANNVWTRRVYFLVAVGTNLFANPLLSNGFLMAVWQYFPSTQSTNKNLKPQKDMTSFANLTSAILYPEAVLVGKFRSKKCGMGQQMAGSRTEPNEYPYLIASFWFHIVPNREIWSVEASGYWSGDKVSAARRIHCTAHFLCIVTPQAV